jgi:hypothetical protein
MTATIPVPTVFEDGTLPHGMRMVVDRELDLLSVSCNCMQDEDGQFVPLVEPGHTFDPKAASEAYNAHLAEVSGP